ncbi:MAG: DNA mismatch repair protein MutS [PVC group bacterium]|nr:DNA mismatch repair protein MutS [PVC group bacterium]
MNKDLTPMMNQYLQIKRNYPDAILFFRLGDFYEMFFDDAKVASSILGLTLTGRGSDKTNRVPMCGIPYHAAENYINRLIKSEQKVAICEQVEDPKATKGIVKREIVRVVTPGTVLGQSVLSSSHNNYVVSVYFAGPDDYGLSVADLSTGEFKITQLNSVQAMLSELTRLYPAELLLPAQLKNNHKLIASIKQRMDVAITEMEDWKFEFSQAYDKLKAHFKTHNLSGFGCENMPSAVSAAGGALRYLEETQKTDLVHINKLTTYSLNTFMTLDSVAQRNLELIRTMRGEKKGTLLNVLNFTQVPMGNRLIVQWMQQPLVDVMKINRRLDAVEELYNNQLLRNQLQEALKNIVDIERLLGRISVGIANARDIMSLNQSLKIIPQLQELLKSISAELLIDIKEGMVAQESLVELIDLAIRTDSPVSVREGGMINPGFNEELDELLGIAKGGKDWLANLQKQEIERTGISSLKIKYNRVFGYYIEITKANLHLVPEDYMRKQTLVNAERFITPALKEQEEKILSAQEKIFELEYELFLKIRQAILDELVQIQTNANLIAILDVLNSFSEAAARNKYTRPELSDDNILKIKNGRHPVLEQLLSSGEFIPNDTALDNTQEQILIITGPNMAGKSTYIRQVALIVLMAQMGSFVPAESAEIGVVDRVFTRVGAADDITAGMSTFMMEMSETANILNNATPRSLIILDEIGRGTSTFDGLSIAWATAEYLHKKGGSKPKTLFATHYHELAELELTCNGVKNYNVAVREWNNEVTFLYKLVKGSADHSYGIHVGRLAGLPQEVISRAREILSNLEINSVSSNGIPSLVKSDSSDKEIQQDLFTKKENYLLKEIQATDINKLTPMEALNLINKWREDMVIYEQD